MFAPSLALGNSDILCACACVFSGENKKTGACTPTHQVQAHSHLALAPLDKPGALATIPDPARACHGPLIHSSHVACLVGRARLLGPPSSDHSPACEKASALCPPNPVAAGRCPVATARPQCQTRWHKTEDRTRRCRASSALAASARDHGGRFLRGLAPPARAHFQTLMHIAHCVRLRLHTCARRKRGSSNILCRLSVRGARRLSKSVRSRPGPGAPSQRDCDRPCPHASPIATQILNPFPRAQFARSANDVGEHD